MGKGDSKKRAVRVIAVTSGKGGVGKSNVVVNLAISLAKLGKRVTILDADLALANIDILLGISPSYNLGHLITGQRRLDEVLVSDPHGINILPATSGIQSLTELDTQQKIRILEELEPLYDEVDILIIDTAAGISSNVIYFATCAYEIVVVVSPEPTSITDSYALMKVLSKDHREKRFRLLVNNVKSEKEAKDVFRKLSTVTERFLKDVFLDYLGYILYDENLTKAVKKQKPFVSLFPDSKGARCFKNIAKKIINEEIELPLSGNIKLFFSKMLGVI